MTTPRRARNRTDSAVALDDETRDTALLDDESCRFRFEPDWNLALEELAVESRGKRVAKHQPRPAAKAQAVGGIA